MCKILLCHKTWSTLCWMVVLFRANSCDRVYQLITNQQVHTQPLLLANIGKPPLSLINCTHLRTQGYQGTGCGTQKYLSVKQVEHTTFHNLLSNALSRNSFQPVHAADNVDLQIVQQAINKSKTKTVVLVGEDTDLLMLLLHHANRDHGDFFVLWKMGGVKETIKGTMGSWFRRVWQPSVVVAQLSRMFFRW